jgi:hypothetical protein
MEMLPDGKHFLSQPSFKITAKGKRHRNEPMACDFEQTVRLPQERGLHQRRSMWRA